MPEATHQLAAIMFTDIVGYTALMGKDEQRAMRLLDKNLSIQKPFIEQHQGKLLKEMGDGLLSSFNSVIEAVKCAIEIQSKLKNDPELNIRVGINVGDVLFKDGDVFGDGVNIASRIVAISKEGEILVSEAVYQNVKNQEGISMEFIKEKHLKNVEEPIKIYRVGDVTLAPVKYKNSEIDEYLNSIVVLPFTNISNDPEQEYFCDGLAEELINSLTKINDVRVVARTTAFSFKRKKLDVHEIGEKLNVKWLLEGSVRKSENRLRINVLLINVSDGFHLWSEQYDRNLEDVLVLQSEVAQIIAREIKVTVTPEERRRLANVSQVNPDAYDAYLKGRFHFYIHSPEHLMIALQYFQQALKIDPNYVLAHGGIGDTWGARTFLGLVAPRESLPKAKEMEQKILELDNTATEVHDLVGRIRFWFEWDWVSAEQEYQASIELNPNYVDVRVFYSTFLSSMKRWEEAEIHMNRAIELDPLNVFFQWHYGNNLYLQSRYEEAISQFRKILQMEPNFLVAHRSLWSSFHLKKMYYEGLTEAKMYFKKLNDQEVVNALTNGLEEADYTGLMHLAAEKLAGRFNRIYVPPTQVAQLYAYAGESDRAVEWLETAYSEGDFQMVYLDVDPSWLKLRTNKRFQKLIERMNFNK